MSDGLVCCCCAFNAFGLDGVQMIVGVITLALVALIGYVLEV
jgi:hypothetical protein